MPPSPSRDAVRAAKREAQRLGLTARLWRLREDAREVAATWRDDEYDNLKDIVSDLVSLYPTLEGALPREAAALARVRRAVLRELAQDPAEAADPIRGQHC